MATLPELERALVNADKAGDADAARRLAAVINKERSRRGSDPSIELVEQIPDSNLEVVPGTISPTQPDDAPTIGEKIVGAAETGATMATGMTSGLVGQIEGTVEGIIKEILDGEFGSYAAADRIEQLAMERAQQFTYTPRTETGQEYLETTGEYLAPLVAIPPLAEAQTLARAASPAIQQVRSATRETAQQVQPQVQAVAQEISRRVREGVTARRQQSTDQSVGAIQVPQTAEQIISSNVKNPFQDVGKVNSVTLPEGQRLVNEIPFPGDSIVKRVLDLADETDPDWKLGILDLPIENIPRQKIISMQPYVNDEFIRKIGSGKTPLAIKSGGFYYIANGTHRAIGELKTGKSSVPMRIFDLDKTGKSSPLDQSIGAAQVAQPTLRQAQADELPVPIKLTEGQKTRDFETQRFERETAKMPEEGAPIRERFEEQNLQLQQNLDEFIDVTGAELTELRGVGELVDKSLRSRAAKDKARIRSLYKEAEKAGEMEAPVSLDSFVRHLNESLPEAEVANVLKAVRAKAIQLGAVIEESDGQLIPNPISLKDAELLRRSINNATNAEPTNIRQAAIMKNLIDETTDGLGGNKYRQARRARVKYAKDYENIGLVKNLLGLKRGSDDRTIALEDVVRKSILEPSSSLDSIRQLRRLLQTKAGDEGKQAWRELQGATLRHIQDQMLKGVTTNQRGDRVVSPAQLDRVISQLDKSGKLDFIFGKKGAEQLRTINDVAKTVLTAPPGTINTSNTATVLAGLMDIALTGSTGVPAPIATSFKLLTGKIKDARLKAKIQKTLGE